LPFKPKKKPIAVGITSIGENIGIQKIPSIKAIKKAHPPLKAPKAERKMYPINQPIAGTINKINKTKQKRYL